MLGILPDCGRAVKVASVSHSDMEEERTLLLAKWWNALLPANN